MIREYYIIMMIVFLTSLLFLCRITAPTFPTLARKTMTKMALGMNVTMMMTMIEFPMIG